MTPRPLRPTRQAFTLIELLVTIGIIAVLIATTLTVIPLVRRKVDATSTSAQMAAIASAIQMYYNDFRAYPGPIPNGMLGGSFYATPVSANVTSLGSTSGTTTTYTASGFPAAQRQQITGSENLVLGLIGGLEFDTTNSTSTTPCYAYNPNGIFPDGMTPAPKGATSLNPNVPKRFASYLQVRAGDLSSGSFVDGGGRAAADSMIPEFLDSFSHNPTGAMPILYLRANTGAGGIVTYAGKSEAGSQVGSYQYDLTSVLGYTSTAIGGASGTGTLKHHGLADVLPASGANINDSITVDGGQAGTNESATNGNGLGANALVYLKDPNTSPSATNANGTPRQKDGYILISAGPDGLYGTADDIIYPGGSVVAQ